MIDGSSHDFLLRLSINKHEGEVLISLLAIGLSRVQGEDTLK